MSQLTCHRHIPYYPLRTAVPNPHISQSLFEELPERTCDEVLIPREYCADRLALHEGCWKNGFECELTAEEDRAALVARLLRISPTYRGINDEALTALWDDTKTLPDAEYIGPLRLRQRLWDGIVVMLAAFVFYAVFARARTWRLRSSTTANSRTKQ